jgi:hypothetical protein
MDLDAHALKDAVEPPHAVLIPEQPRKARTLQRRVFALTHARNAKLVSSD